MYMYGVLTPYYVLRPNKKFTQGIVNIKGLGTKNNYKKQAGVLRIKVSYPACQRSHALT